MKNRKTRYGISILIYLFSAIASFSQPLRINTQALSDYDSLFTRYTGWTGADGAYSLALSDNSILWLYSDTWVGEIRDNRHVDSVIVNNSVALQTGKNPLTARASFFYGQGDDGKPAALLRPADGRGWFWIYDGILTKKGLHLFLMQIDKDAGGFRHIGNWLGTVANPRDLPTKWRVKQSKIPFGRFSPAEGDSLFGSALLKAGKYIYIYGTDEVIENGWFHRKRMILARVPENEIEDFTRWRFYADGGKWQKDFRKASFLADNLANEYSVSFQKSLGKYVAVYTDGGISKNIVLRTSRRPFGKWSEPVTVFQCPEANWSEKIICYAAKAHPELSQNPDELIVTYIASSTDFWHMASDARLYRPRFLRLKFQ